VDTIDQFEFGRPFLDAFLPLRQGWEVSDLGTQLMPVPKSTRCLILACGNTLRSDDGVGPWLAEWAGERFRGDAGIQILSRQQWTPELAEDLAQAQSVIFIDCSLESEPGHVDLVPVVPADPNAAIATHHLGAPELLALARELYGSAPKNALLLTVGAASTEIGERFSDAVKAALPGACAKLEQAVQRLGAES
jgi:hydrogenase maturation protease